MRQLLMLGFYCEVYRREPRCRVFVNNVLLDEFNITHAPSKQGSVDSSTRLSPQYFSQEYIRLKLDTPFLKYIEFDDQGAKEADIRIEIQNDDNNYANGFMNKSTCVMMLYTFLLSEKLLNNLDDLKNNWKFSFKNHRIQSKRDIDIYYSNRKNQIFENFVVEMVLKFPGIDQEQISVEEVKKHHDNWRDLPPMWRNYTGEHLIGSTGYFHLKLKKKLGFWRHVADRRKGRWKIGQIVLLVEELYNKYKHYEDPRSTDT